MKRKLWYGCLLLTFAIFLNCGCISVDCGYAPNEGVVRVPFEEIEKVAVTYSVSLVKDRTDFFFDPDLDDLRDKLSEALKETNLFSEVYSTPDIQKEGYHIDFKFYLGGQDESLSIACGMIAGVSYFAIPVWEDGAFDGSAVVYLRGQAIASFAQAEKICFMVWLPFAPVGVFWNCAVGWHYVEKGVINGMVNDFSVFHQKQFQGND